MKSVVSLFIAFCLLMQSSVAQQSAAVDSWRFAGFAVNFVLTRGLNPALADDRSLQIRFEPATKRGGMLIDVRINDQPAVLILDTGSAHTILQPRLLGKAAPKVASTQRPNHGGGFVGDAVAAEVSLQLGRWKWERRRVVIMDLSQVLSAYGEVDGILGLDFLEEFSSVVIDSKANMITFTK